MSVGLIPPPTTLKTLWIRLGLGGHPKGPDHVFFTEMWERFSYLRHARDF